MNLGQILKTKMKTRKEQNIKDCTCEDCGAIKGKKELDYNAQFGGYGFKRVCNRCADRMENQIAAQQDQF